MSVRPVSLPTRLSRFTGLSFTPDRAALAVELRDALLQARVTQGVQVELVQASGASAPGGSSGPGGPSASIEVAGAGPGADRGAAMGLLLAASARPGQAAPLRPSSHGRSGTAPGGALFVVPQGPLLGTTVALLITDPQRHYADRLIHVPLRGAAPAPADAPTLTANQDPARGRVRRIDLFPGAAYPIAEGATGLRGQVLRHGAPLPYCRAVAALPDGTAIGWAHGDERGEFVLILGPRARRGGLPTEFSLVLTLHRRAEEGGSDLPPPEHLDEDGVAAGTSTAGLIASPPLSLKFRPGQLTTRSLAFD